MAGNREAAARAARAGGVDHQIELHRRRAAEAVDQQQAFAPRAAAQVAEDRAQHLLGDRIRRRQLDCAGGRARRGCRRPSPSRPRPARKWACPQPAPCRRSARRPSSACGRSPSRRAPAAPQAAIALGGRADDLLDDQRAGDAAPAGRPGRVRTATSSFDHAPSDSGLRPASRAAISKFMTSPS